jgi:hypothetical protein
MDDVPVECISCGGPLVLLGSIGFLEWYCCENCGQEQSRRIGEFEPPEGWDDDDDDEGDDEADDDRAELAAGSSASADTPPPESSAESPPRAEDPGDPLTWLRDSTTPGAGFSISGCRKRRRPKSRRRRPAR